MIKGNAITMYPARGSIAEHADDLSPSLPALRASLQHIPRHPEGESAEKLRTGPSPIYDTAQLRPVHDPTQRIVVEEHQVNLFLRGCGVKTSQRLPTENHVMLEFQAGEYDLPITIDEAIVRTRFAEGVGLRFSSFLRSEERRIRHILDLRLPNPAS